MVFVDALLATARLDALGSAAAILEYPLPRETDEATCQQGARVVDALLVRVARGHGALDVAIGEGLEALAPRKMHLGFATIGDYAREKLGIAASTAQKMVRFAKALRDKPILRAAVWAGNVPVRAAEAVLSKAVGEEEGRWVELARTSSVRALQAAVKGADPPASEEEDEKWGPIRAQVRPEGMPTVDEAMEVARRVVNAAAPPYKLLEALCEEFLGGHEPPDFAASCPDDLVAARREESDALKEWLEKESAQWAFLGQPVPIAAPVPGDDVARDPEELDRELRRLAALRDRWDEVVGHLALLFRSIDDEESKRELESLEVVKVLRHPYLLGTQMFKVFKNRLYIVMELLEGRTLRDLLAREAPLDPARSVSLMLQACSAVGAFFSR